MCARPVRADFNARRFGDVILGQMRRVLGQQSLLPPDDPVEASSPPAASRAVNSTPVTTPSPTRYLRIQFAPSCRRLGLGYTHQLLNLECAAYIAEITDRVLLVSRPSSPTRPG